MPYNIAKDILAGTPVLATVDEIVTNGDGSISFKRHSDNYFLTQEPNVYGQFRWDARNAQYQRFTPIGEMVFTSLTRPGDAVFVYTYLEFKVYPS